LIPVLLTFFYASTSIEALENVHYYWKVMPVGKTADLLTLFCGSSRAGAAGSQDIPLVAVLRDNLGFVDPEDTRIFFVWLLPYSRPSVGQDILSTAPFFYWSSKRPRQSISPRAMGPLLDLSTPEQPVVSALRRNILQWALFDQLGTPIRAVSRAQSANRMDEQRLLFEAAITYLQHAPVSDNRSELTRSQLDSVIARLALRKHLMGGLVNDHSIIRISNERRVKEERIRSRNWELLRQCADKTSLLFEPLNLAGEIDGYAILWFPLKQSRPTIGFSQGPIWKLLNIKDPWSDPLLRRWSGRTYNRSLDKNGVLLPFEALGVSEISVVPIGVYSLTYPKAPLLIIDFRHQQHVRRHEIIQRAITETMSGVLGVSRFTNWYYYAALGFYEFVSARHGAAVDQESRLDSYVRFRVEVMLDRGLDPVFRKEIEQRMNSLIVNPLIVTADCERQAAAVHYVALAAQSENDGQLMARLRKARRLEIALFSRTTRRQVMDNVLYVSSFGLYRHRAAESVDNIGELDCYRRINYQLKFLDSLVAAGTPPEVGYDIARLHGSITELHSLLIHVQAPSVRAHATNTLRQLSGLSRNSALQDECSLAIASFRPNSNVNEMLVLDSKAGVTLSKRVASAE